RKTAAAAGEVAVSRTPLSTLLYALQQSINGLSLGCLYALIAVGYTMVYGISRIVNFAFGEFYMMGAFLTFIGYALVLWLGGSLFPFAIVVILIGTAATVAGYSWAADKMALRHMRSTSL